MVTTEILDLVIAEKGLNVPAPAVEAPIETEKKKK
jgi:hypothetical protein